MFDNITDTLLGAALEKGGILMRAENRIRQFAAKSSVPDRIEESRDDLGKRWSLRDADRVFTALGKEAWARVYPTPFGLKGDDVEIVSQEKGLGQIYGEGMMREVPIRTIDFRGKEKNG